MVFCTALSLRRWFLSGLALCMLGAFPLLHADERNHGDHAMALQALEQGRVLPLRTVLEKIERDYQGQDAVRTDIRRILLANAMTPLAGNKPLVEAIQKHGQAVFGEPIPTSGTPLYTDVRLYCERGIPAVIYGAGPRTVLESNAKRADEHIVLEDLRRATKVVARSLFDLLG